MAAFQIKADALTTAKLQFSGSAFGWYSPTMTDHLVESRHRIWGDIFDADKGVAQYPLSELNLQFSSVRPSKLWKIESELRLRFFVDPEHKTVCDHRHYIDRKSVL